LISDLRDIEQLLRADGSSTNVSSTPGSITNGILVMRTTVERNNKDSSISIASGHGAWVDLEHLCTYPSYVSEDVSDPVYKHVKVSVSLCYPAFWTARLDITLNSSESRKEPTALSLDERERYRTEPDVHFQMGQYKRDHEITYVWLFTES
jgi:hypothetical protein